MRISFAVKDNCRYLGLGRYAGYTQGSSEYSVKSLTEREVHPQQGGQAGKKVAGEQGTMRTPLYSPHSLSRPGKGGGHHHGNNKSGEATNPYSSLPYATYRRPAPGVPPSFASPPTANDFNSHHFQTFGRHECFAAPCPITSMSRPDLLMSQTTVGSGSVGWEGGCRGPTSSTQLKATPTTGLNLQISCISTQQQQAPLATRVSLSKERLAETRCSIVITIVKIIKIIISIIIIIILPGSLCLPMCSSAGLRLLTAVNPLTHPS